MTPTVAERSGEFVSFALSCTTGIARRCCRYSLVRLLRLGRGVRVLRRLRAYNQSKRCLERHTLREIPLLYDVRLLQQASNVVSTRDQHLYQDYCDRTMSYLERGTVDNGRFFP